VAVPASNCRTAQRVESDALELAPPDRRDVRRVHAREAMGRAGVMGPSGSVGQRGVLAAEDLSPVDQLDRFRERAEVSGGHDQAIATRVDQILHPRVLAGNDRNTCG
jgi:hypothetical protein